MTQCMPGCVFEFYGKIPESIYDPVTFGSPLEEAVYRNDLNLFTNLLKEGHKVTIRLKIGQMSCIEYASMKGYVDILSLLLRNSVCHEMLTKYFSLSDVVDRAYLISKNKSVFFGQEALAEANRYIAALYTAVIYNQPLCVKLLLGLLRHRDLAQHNFYTDEMILEKLSAIELAKLHGHTECYKLILQWYQSTTHIE
jgi:ankyrin repeat protein